MKTRTPRNRTATETAQRAALGVLRPRGNYNKPARRSLSQARGTTGDKNPATLGTWFFVPHPHRVIGRRSRVRP